MTIFMVQKVEIIINPLNLSEQISNLIYFNVKLK